MSKINGNYYQLMIVNFLKKAVILRPRLDPVQIPSLIEKHSSHAGAIFIRPSIHGDGIVGGGISAEFLTTETDNSDNISIRTPLVNLIVFCHSDKLRF